MLFINCNNDRNLLYLVTKCPKKNTYHHLMRKQKTAGNNNALPVKGCHAILKDVICCI